MTKIFLKTLSSFYYERIIVSAPSDFTEMVNMGMGLEEGVCEGRLSKEEVSSSKKYGYSFARKKEGETNAVSVGRQKRPHVRRTPHPRQHHHQVSFVIPVISNNQTFSNREIRHKFQNHFRGGISQNSVVPFTKGILAMMVVQEVSEYLVEMHKTLCTISDCEHDHVGCAICSVNPRGCSIVKRDIQRLMYENVMQIQQSRDIDDANVIVLVFKTPERVVIQFDSSNSNNSNRLVLPLVIWLSSQVPYVFNRVVLYQYNATMVENGQEVPLPTTNSVVNIADIAKVTRSGRVFRPVFPKDVEDVSKKVEVPVVDPVSTPKCQSGESNSLKPNDDDEVLHLIKKSEFNMVEQLLQTPSKISVLSLLMNSEAHREALQKVLEQAYVEHDVTVDQFDHIVANITSCNNLRFCDEELPEEGRNHNLELHISMNCKEDVLSNVMVDIGSSLNVLPKSTLSRLSYE
ncbi:hypothetical protein KIW84_051099 [Lathyrus oleraceus]|uniref:Uncharacterized protein n=1 Tax=Pisum sativum TaxID=3888 RepID=A0A9D4WJ97_PEA|nr:hypothetical protein KIW84_051099 [Pisum sativum]